MSNDSAFAPPFFIAKCEPSGQQVDAWTDQQENEHRQEVGLDMHGAKPSAPLTAARETHLNPAPGARHCLI